MAELGRRARLKIWCPSGRGGSIPPPGTKFFRPWHRILGLLAACGPPEDPPAVAKSLHVEEGLCDPKGQRMPLICREAPLSLEMPEPDKLLIEGIEFHAPNHAPETRIPGRESQDPCELVEGRPAQASVEDVSCPLCFTSMPLRTRELPRSRVVGRSMRIRYGVLRCSPTWSTAASVRRYARGTTVVRHTPYGLTTQLIRAHGA